MDECEGGLDLPLSTGTIYTRNCSCCNRNVPVAWSTLLDCIWAQLAQAACVRYACLRAPCRSWPLLLPSFSLSFFLSFSLSPHIAFHKLLGQGYPGSGFFMATHILTQLKGICKINKYYFWVQAVCVHNPRLFIDSFFTAIIQSRPSWHLWSNFSRRKSLFLTSSFPAPV